MSVGWIVVSFFSTLFFHDFYILKGTEQACQLSLLDLAWPRSFPLSPRVAGLTFGRQFSLPRGKKPLHHGSLAGTLDSYHSIPKTDANDRFNLLGQVAVTTGITFGLANLISVTATVGTRYAPTAGKTIGIYAALLISHGVINSFGVRILRFLNNTSIILHSIGVACFAVAILAKAPTHQSAKFVFATFYDGTGDPGWSVRASPAYVAVCGVLMSQYTITGYVETTSRRNPGLR